MRPLNEIIIHCAATRPDWMKGTSIAEKRDEIRRWHLERGWRDIGYHYLIDRDGSSIEGRPLDQTGAHVKGRNTGTIGVCLMGGHGSSENDGFTDHFTPEQDAALRQLIDALVSRYGSMKVTGHNQYAAKACPGFYVPTWYNGGQVRKQRLDVPDEVKSALNDAAKSPQSQTSLWAVVASYTGGAYTFWQTADTETRVALLACGLMLAYIMRERLRKMRLGKVAKEALGL